MSLKSQLFKGDAKLNACSTQDAAHILQGASGNHVAKIQLALFVLDGLGIDDGEVSAKVYGPSTAKGVLAFKTKRRIVNYGYQTQPDNIVGKMTIAAMDSELVRKQGIPGGRQQTYCGNDRQAANTSAPSL